MSKRQVFNNSTNLGDDTCAREQQISSTTQYSDYNLPDFRMHPKNGRQKFIQALDELGISQDSNLDNHYDSSIINAESHMQNGKTGNMMTCGKEKANKLLETRLFLTVPYMGNGGGDPDVMSDLLSPELSRDKHSMRGSEQDRFDPLVPSLRKEIQDPKHYIPKYWVRGGMDTRAVIRNADYLKSCGIKK